MEGFIDMIDSQELSRRQRNQLNHRRLAGYTLVWLVSLALVYFGHRYLWDGSALVTTAMVGINIIAGIAMMMANKKLLAGLDELEQKVQLEAMALALGAGLVGGFAYSALSQTGILPFHAEISHLAVFIALTYLVAMVKGVKKYQ